MLRSLPSPGNPTLTTIPAPAALSAPTPTRASFTFSFINSMGGSVVTSNALYFLTKQGFEFSQSMNFLLGCLLGVVYIAGALAAKPLLDRLRILFPSLSTRGVLSALMLVLAALCFVPQASASSAPDGKPAAWAIWAVVLLYSPATGMLWPIVESYVSGGRSGSNLRSTMGVWNVVWSAAGLFITLVVTPIAERAATLVIASIGLTHLAALFPLKGFGPEPGEHLEAEHEPHPPAYADLLVTFRLLLPLAYVVMSAIGPYLPSLAERLGLLKNWSVSGVTLTLGGLLPIAWVAARVATFAALARWQSWHGRWSFAIFSGSLMLAGYAGLVFSPLLPRAPGIALALMGLAAFGTAAAAIYTAAIYYAMEVGKADVNAGGRHEALIGVGYTLGPGIGLASTIAVERGWVPPAFFEPLMLGTVGVLALLTAAQVVRRVHLHSRNPA